MPRIHYGGALYHIISRGNFRQDLFTFGNAGPAFERAIFEASIRCGWVLHASKAAEPAKRSELIKKFERGWAKGSAKSKKELVKDLAEMTTSKDWGGKEMAEVNEMRWDDIVRCALAEQGRREEDLRNSLKGADWKIEIARELRRTTAAPNPWIARRLNMGHPARVSMVAGGKNVKV